MRSRNIVIFLSFIIGGCAPKETATIQYGELSDFTLTATTADHESVVTKKDLLGRAWIASFILTNCNGPCPILSGNMEKLQSELPGSIGLLSFTVDPDHDSVEALQRYAKRFHADPSRWYFLRAEKAPLYKLLEEGFKIAAGEDKNLPLAERFVHTTKFVLLDQTGAIRGYYDGDNVYGLTKLKRDAIKLIQGEKSI